MPTRTANRKINFPRMELTENGYTPEFEAAILAAAEEADREIANGTAKIYESVEELFADMDAEDDNA